MKNALNALYLFVVLVAGYFSLQSFLHSRRLVSIEKAAKINLSCETDADCEVMVYEKDFCGRATKAVTVSKKSARYAEMKMTAARTTMPSLLDGMARRLFRDCNSVSDTANVTCVESRCK